MCIVRKKHLAKPFVISIKRVIFAKKETSIQEANITITKDMATPIKQVPILTGDIAAAFVREAEENEKLPRHQISSEDEARVKCIAKQLHEFKFPWDKK